MSSNEMLEEIWKIRDEHAHRFNDKLEAIFDDLRNQQKAGTRQVVSFINALPESIANKTVKQATEDEAKQISSRLG